MGRVRSTETNSSAMEVIRELEELQQVPKPSQYEDFSSSEEESVVRTRGKRQSAARNLRRRIPAQTPQEPSVTHRPSYQPGQSAQNWDLSPIVVSPTESDISPGPGNGHEFPFSSPGVDLLPREDIGTITPLTPPESDQFTRRIISAYASDQSPLPRTARHSSTRATGKTVSVKQEELESDDEDHEIGKKINVSRKLFSSIQKSRPKVQANLGLDCKDTTTGSHTETKREETSEGKNIRTRTETPSEVSSSRWLGYWLDRIVPFDVHERYAENQKTCVASRANFKIRKRCTQRRKADLRDIFPTLSSCFRHYEDGKHVDLCSLLNTFVGSVLCPSHRIMAMEKISEDGKVTGLKQTVTLETYLRQLSEEKGRAKWDNTLPESSSAFTRAEFETWLQALSKTVKDATVGTTPIVDCKASSADPVPFTPRAPSRNDSLELQVVGSWQKKCDENEPVSEVIFNAIWQVLPPLAQRDGHIYVLTHHSDKRYRKIGFTLGDPEKRRKQWDKCCGRHHGYQILPGNGKFRHAFRAEQLIQAELKDKRVRVECDRCKSNHGEWFEVTEAHLRNVFLRWKHWISQKPYAQDVGNIWSLKAQVVPSLKNACEPLIIEKNIEPPKAMTRTIQVEARIPLRPIKE